MFGLFPQRIMPEPFEIPAYSIFDIRTYPQGNYTTVDLILQMVGLSFWAIAYAGLVWSIVKHKFVEMPMFACCANVGWEFLWGFIFLTDFIIWFSYLCVLGFGLDAFIFHNLTKYGHKQASIPSIPLFQKYFKPLCFFMVFVWTIILFFLYQEGLDTPIGAHSGYILNLQISILYIILFLKQNNPSVFSPVVAWSKMLGTGLITVSMFTIYPGDHVAQTAGIIVLILDCTYINLLHKGRREMVAVAAA